VSRRQPYLHDLIALVSAPTQAWCSITGDIAAGSVGVIFSDIQVVAGLTLTFDGEPVTWVRRHVTGATATFVGIARHLQDELISGADPRVTVVRTRRIGNGVVEEQVDIHCALDIPVRTVIEVTVLPTLDPIDRVKEGSYEPAAADLVGDTARWANNSVAAALTSDARCNVAANTIRLQQPVEIPPGGSAGLTWRLELVASAATPVVAATAIEPQGGTEWVWPAAGSRLRRWLDHSLSDLASLKLEHRAMPGQPFFGAGAPWYLTLFGRDSLWAARLSRRLNPGTAHSTLRALATLQGRKHDPMTEEAPGKILHEIRGSGFTTLPARYYGTIDATSLWVNLLADLVEDGNLAEADRRELRPALEAALGWITGPYADSDGDGLLEYSRSAEQGLVNQGWKDSDDAVRFADGRIADGPIALCEAQGYAYAAAVRGASILERLGGDPGSIAVWAGDLKAKFQDRFCRNGFPGFALDGKKVLVDSTTSNIGHLLGTGILEADQERAVADRLLKPDMFSGLGLRTMSAADAGYHPLSYHCGSVWAHDTAVAIDGMLRTGLDDHAARLASGLVAAANIFDDRLPELWSGEAELGVPYPASCQPQAWAAAAAVPAIEALLSARAMAGGWATADDSLGFSRRRRTGAAPPSNTK
jgi:hypothetical protein